GKSLDNARRGKENLLNKFKYRGVYSVNAHRDLFTKEVILWHGEAFNNVGAVFQNSGLFDEALEMYGKSSYMIPDDFVAHYNSALIYRYNKKYTKAAGLFKEAIEKAPDFAPSYKQLAILYANNLNDPGEAVHYFEKYLSFDPKDRDVPNIIEYIKKNKGRSK
ncbi:tetratricopeptide repeat protein, partial [Candidatus Margulisiibacteriota bacterium]